MIFFLTDADDPMSASEMAEIEQANARSGTAICVIEFGRTLPLPQNNFLTELARAKRRAVRLREHDAKLGK